MSKKIHSIDTQSIQQAQDLKEYLQATYTPEMQEVIEGQNNPYLGTDNPEITIVEFADFACVYCKQASTAMRQIASLYEDKVKIIFRDRPAFDNSLALALAAHCAGEQGKFWEMHDKLYQYQSETLGDNASDLITIAKQLNLDLQQLAICVDEQRYLDHIKANFTSSQSLSVQGTPTWFINGQKIEGAISLDNWQKILNQLLD